MREVLMATPYQWGELGSFGKAKYMLIRQHEFPHVYNDDEIMLSADHDRCFDWDYEHTRKCFDRHTGTGERGFAEWVQRSASVNQVMSFLKDVLKAEENHPNVVWTGFRIMGTVNRSNGYTVWTLQLFSKNQKSKTKVYSSPFSPNVFGGGRELGYRLPSNSLKRVK